MVKHPRRVRRRQHWDEVSLLLFQAAVLPRSDAGSDGVEPASHDIIQNHPTAKDLYSKDKFLYTFIYCSLCYD